MHKEFKKARKKKTLEYKNNKLFLLNYNSNVKKSIRCRFGFHRLDYKNVNYRSCELCGDFFVRVNIPGFSSFFNLTRELRKGVI